MLRGFLFKRRTSTQLNVVKLKLRQLCSSNALSRFMLLLGSEEKNDLSISGGNFPSRTRSLVLVFAVVVVLIISTFLMQPTCHSFVVETFISWHSA